MHPKTLLNRTVQQNSFAKIRRGPCPCRTSFPYLSSFFSDRLQSPLFRRATQKIQEEVTGDILVVWTAGKFSMDMRYMRRLGVLSTAEVPLKALSMQISKRFPCSNN
jgi:hypothetical protein